MIEGFVGLFCIGLMFVLVWNVFALVADMAAARGQSGFAWIVVSLIWSPFGSMAVLWLFVPLCNESGRGESV